MYFVIILREFAAAILALSTNISRFNVTDDLHVVSRTEETPLIIGIYVFGPTVSGVTICLLLCLIRYAITNPENNAIAPYLVGVFSMLFSILLNTAYCILGTDLLVPWNDSELLENSYDTNTMLEFTSLCIFLWHFSKLLLYISFIYYLYTTLSIHSSYIVSAIYLCVMMTILSVIALIYANDDFYDIALTPTHEIQVVTQLKGYFFNFNSNHSITLTEIASMMPLFTDIASLIALFKMYAHETHDESHVMRKHLEQCLRCIMLLFCGSIPSWILYINIFVKSSIVWMIIPYDQLINNVCLFLMYSENKYLYNILCINCHRAVSNRWIPPKLASKHDDDDDYRFANEKHKLKELEIIPSKSESMSKHKFVKKQMKKQMKNSKMDGLHMNTDDEVCDKQGNDAVFGQYLSVEPRPKGIEIKYNHEGKMNGKKRSLNSKNISPSPSASLSTSNIIKSIVMGNDKESRRRKSYNTDYLQKRCMDDEIEESIQRSIESASKISSETSISTSISAYNEKQEFVLSPLCITPSISRFNLNDNVKNGNRKSSCCDSSDSSSFDEDDDDDDDDDMNTNTTVTVERYLHRRSTIDLANVIQKELYELEDGDEDEVDDESVSMVNVGVPSFGHTRVHFSFFE